LQALTANLLRVIGGAGKPQLIGEQASVLAKALSETADDGGSAIAKVLSDLPTPAFDLASRREYGDCEADWRRARWLVMHGTLQILAAEMLGQQTQAKIGNKRLAAGLRAFEDLRDRQRDLLNGDDETPEPLLRSNGASSGSPALTDGKGRQRKRGGDRSSRRDAGKEMPAE
jgi:hypothetical protein